MSRNGFTVRLIIAWPCLHGLGCRMALVGSGWPVSLPRMNGLTKQSSHLVEPTVKSFPSLDELAATSDY